MTEDNRTVGEVIKDLKRVPITFHIKEDTNGDGKMEITDKLINPVDEDVLPKDLVTLDQYSSFLYYKNNQYQGKMLTNDQLRNRTDKFSMKPKDLYKDLNLDLSYTTEKSISSKKFNNNVMFLGMNMSERPDRAKRNAAWFNFHMMPDEKIDLSMIYFYLESHENDTFDGCYITDLLKNTIESNGGKAVTDALIKDESHENELRDCAYIFQQEFHIIHPKVLVVLAQKQKKGKPSNLMRVLNRMLEIGCFKNDPELCEFLKDENLTQIARTS